MAVEIGIISGQRDIIVLVVDEDESKAVVLCSCAKVGQVQQ